MINSTEETSASYLTNHEIRWMGWGHLLGFLRTEHGRGSITVYPQGWLGEFFMRKAGLRIHGVGKIPLTSKKALDRAG